MKQTKKQLQVAGLIQKEFSLVLQLQGSFIYQNALVTVTRVRMTSDMGLAYIYLSVYNANDKEAILKRLWENIGRLRGDLGKRISSQVRRIPMLKFFLDETLDEIDQVNQLLDNLEYPSQQAKSTEDLAGEEQENT